MFYVFLSPEIFSQERQIVDFDNFIQEIFQQQDEDISYEELYESLFQCYTEPLDINKAGRDELSSLYILSPIQINNFLKHRQENGFIISLYELQAIPEFDAVTIHKLLPFIIIKDPLSANNLLKRMVKSENTFLLLRYERTLEEKNGYIKDSTGGSSYAGSADKYYLRFKNSRSRDFSYGITMEKDPGEIIAWSPSKNQYGTDYFSWHFTLYNRKKIKAISIGDYQLQFGQGLVLASGFNIGKGAETILTTKRNNLGIRPYTSAMESGYFRGAAITYSIGQFDVTQFYSNKNIDGNVSIESESLKTFNIVNTGYHRTEKEINTKQLINEKIFGSNIIFNNKNKAFHSGATFVDTQYDISLATTEDIYNQFEFSGTHNYTMGIDLSYSWQNFIFFGEAATSKNKGKGIITGFLSSLSSKAELSMVYRNYGKNFQTIYGNAFGENTRPVNEQGFYSAIKIKPFSQLTLSAYFDKFSFPWLKYMVDAPSEGYEYLTRLTYKPSKTISLYIQYREEKKEKNQSDNHTNIDFIVPSLKRNYLLNMDYVSSEFLSLRSRVQFSNYRQSNSPTFGYAIMQDINLNFGKIKFSSRFALFETDDYDNRQYTDEKDVLYSFSLPAYYGKGIRMYLLTQIRLSSKTDVWLRIARTNYLDEKSISSGTEEIIGSVKTDVKMQMRYTF